MNIYPFYPLRSGPRPEKRAGSRWAHRIHWCNRRKLFRSQRKNWDLPSEIDLHLPGTPSLPSLMALTPGLEDSN